MSEEEDAHVEPSAPETQVQLFMNSKCQRHHLYFKSRAVIPEREIEIKDVRHHELLELIHFYQFHKLNKSCRVKVSKTLVREFYANLRPEIEEDGEDLDIVFLRGKRMRVNAAVINQFYGFDPVEGFSVTDIAKVCLKYAISEISGQTVTTAEEVPKYVYRHQLSTFYRMLHSYICDTLIPTGHGTSINHDRVKFMYYLGQKNKFDIGSYMFSKMMNLVIKPTSRTALPYGGFICALASLHGVPLFESDVFPKKKGPIRKLTFDRLLQLEEDASAPSPQSTDQASQHQRQPSSQPDSQQQSHGRFDELSGLVGDKFDRVFKELGAISKNQMIIWNKLMQIEDVVNGLCESDEDEEAPPTVAEKAG